MKATGDTSALQWLLLVVLLAGGHETRHLMLGELNLAATKGREVDVGNLELLCWLTHLDGVVLYGVCGREMRCKKKVVEWECRMEEDEVGGRTMGRRTDSSRAAKNPNPIQS